MSDESGHTTPRWSGGDLLALSLELVDAELGRLPMFPAFEMGAAP